MLAVSTVIRCLLLLFWLWFPLVTEPRLGQSGVGDAVSRAEVGHGEGQSQLRSRRHSSCKNSQKRSTLTSELARVGGLHMQACVVAAWAAGLPWAWGGGRGTVGC